MILLRMGHTCINIFWRVGRVIVGSDSGTEKKFVFVLGVWAEFVHNEPTEIWVSSYDSKQRWWFLQS